MAAITSVSRQQGWGSHDSLEDQNGAISNGDYAHDGYETARGAAAGYPYSPHTEDSDFDPFAKRDASEPFPATKDSDEYRHADKMVEINAAQRSRSRSPVKMPTSPADDGQPAQENQWIHRDKLARIEREELQAAGIVLPKSRSRSRPRRDRSTDKASGRRRATDASEEQYLPRSRKNSLHSSISMDKTPDAETPTWDVRRPQEIAEDPNEYWISSETLGTKGSRIPIAKTSPAPIPSDYLERDAPVPRKMSGSGTIFLDEEFSLSIAKSRSRTDSNPILDQTPSLQPPKRSATEGTSPKKTAQSGSRKPSTTSAKSTNSTSRPKTRSGPNKDSSASTTRPTTRSGEILSPVKAAPEGDPPWMISAYKPDPRLPPDQQLLPTVARRLQQEQWEREGKFGSVYDKEFRPLTDEGFGNPPPELEKPAPEESKQEPVEEWPLRTDTTSPTLSRPGTSSYSTMPRIQDKPMMSPRLPTAQPTPEPPAQITRVPTQPEQPQISEKKAKSGCGCCVVM
ncbi:hypothetical protein BX600DRAFT_441170 [Xylariales sp. PMI_506]|nr:hypothetical protein BX600DRAFT_441170 [Xylariales sp. PMI_506]